MLSEKQLSEIRKHLEKAQKPVFFYDNDIDGLCSSVLLMRYIGRGKAVAVRTNPDLGPGYAKKAQELNADYIFVLDRHSLGKEFVEEVKGLQIPIIWIDHHDVEEVDFDYDNIYVYNPTKAKTKKSSEPVTYLAYSVTRRKEDMWIAIMGCIGDHYMPSFSKEFSKDYWEYWIKGDLKDPFEALYKTEIGHFARALSYGLKDSVTHVIYLQNFLVKCKCPGDILLELESRSSFAKKYGEIKKKYDSLIQKAKDSVSENSKMVFFSYGGGLSISSEISNELSFLYPDYFIISAYRAGALSNLSIRGNNVREVLEKLLSGFENSSGGGHKNAVGARIMTDDLDRFKEEFEKIVLKRKE
jgi:single-stranded DNA-specific DHH superfamily exonuclease